ncbi:hypothetical protein [Jeotgalibacillus campisalis]|uniref:Uncharacterized protein n=1 Tax=Jeotgalibacillus campisalis TaxID=220754 RepID=A0A0C2W4Y8_9BACL|nr:hypothetical protein [Jeotgalibacillus campisalis]KIL51078.1 hypothetical protein KR50_09590 [Jeotgalibacillus campisalis]
MKFIDLENTISGKYSVKKREGNGETVILLYPNNPDGSPNLDGGYHLVGNHSEKDWKLYEIQRDKKFLKAVFPREEPGLLGLYLAVKKVYEHKQSDFDREMKNKLRNINQPGEGIDLLEQQFDKNLFSFNKETEGAITIFQEGTEFSVCYISTLGECVPITKNRPLQSAFSAAYNYCQLLTVFSELLKDWKGSLQLTLAEEEKVKRIFLGK